MGRVENVKELALELGCKIGVLPSSYLRLPLGALHKSVVAWDGMEERFWKRLAMWKRQFISKGGRSTLSNIPIYYMSLLRMPKVVRLRLEQIQRDFLWGGGALEQKTHLVNWCFVEEREALWKQVIGWKFGVEQGGWYTRVVKEGFGVGLWKEIRKEGSLLNNIVFSVVFKEELVAEVWDSSVEGGGELESLFFLAFQRLRGGLGGTTPLDNSRKRGSGAWKCSPISEEYHMKPLCSS
ncbi:hypothetical protein CK203_074193 [Vitis vinifera]|uniref:Uncharacterized protein n=1 Tax=Vitis vinifera TaxID=29760 RepID=A0A438DTM3_VITVI|nr:hypothetical protein CK203_074193 [Vitis vinifera]